MGTMVATAMAWAMAMAMVSMVATTGASMARGVLMLRPTPTTMVAMAMVAMAVAMVAIEATMEAMVATTGANKDLAKHQDGILSLFRTGSFSTTAQHCWYLQCTVCAVQTLL